VAVTFARTNPFVWWHHFVFDHKTWWEFPDLGIVDVTSSVCLNDDWVAKYCFSRRCENENFLMNTWNQWVQLNWKNMSIVVI
jgi:hypothetical protein